MSLQSLWQQPLPKASDAQIRKICALMKEKDLVDYEDIWRTWLFEKFGKTSRTQLTTFEAADFIDWIEKG